LITYLPHKKLDKAKWNQCVAADPGAPVFFYSWFLDAVCDNWDGLTAGDYEAVFPLPFKSKLGVQYIVQPFFTRTLDACSANKEWKNAKLFLDHIPAKFRLQEFCLEIPVPANDKKSAVEKKYQALLLNRPYDELKKHFSNSTLQNIRKAEKNGTTITHDVSPKDITDDFRKLKGKDIVKFGTKDFQRLRQLMETCLEHGSGHARAAYSPDGERLASAFFMHAHNRIIYLKGSTDDRGKKTGAMHYIMSRMMIEFSNSPVIFDFGGSSVPSLAVFFKSFGATDHIYYTFNKNNLPLALRWLK